MEKALFDDFSDQRFLRWLRTQVGVIINEEAGMPGAPMPPRECVDSVVLVVLEEANMGKIGSDLSDFFERARGFARETFLRGAGGLN